MNRVRGNRRVAKRFDIVAVVSQRRRPDEGNSSSASPQPQTTATPATCAIGLCHSCPCWRCCSSFAPAPEPKPSPTCQQQRQQSANCFRLRGSGCARGQTCCGSRRRVAMRACRQHWRESSSDANSSVQSSSFAAGSAPSQSGESKSDESNASTSSLHRRPRGRRGCDHAPERARLQRSSADECFDSSEQSYERIISKPLEVQELAARKRNRETRAGSCWRAQGRTSNTSLKGSDQNSNNKSTGEIYCNTRAKHKHETKAGAKCASGSQATARTSILKPSRQASQANQDLEACALDNGENSRCNCAGRRRPTFAGLVELFEQQVHVDCARPDAIKRQASAKASSAGDMRNILTPVKYEATPSASSTSCEDLDDSIECRTGAITNEAKSFGCECRSCWPSNDDHDEQLDSLDYRNPRARARASKSPIERIISTGGIQVLPSCQSPINKTNARSSHNKDAYLHKKLTKTHWQPPTDARKYELRSHGRRSASRQHIDQVSGLPITRTTTGAGLASSLAAGQLCPALVRHQPSSSQRQLKQLARLKQLDELAGLYKVNRQGRRQTEASAARVEELIEQLERATAEMDEDEHLLDRAARRDLPAKFQERMNGELSKSSQQQQSNDATAAATAATAAAAAADGREQKEESAATAKRPQLLDFGRRVDVDPLEEESIARSHCAMRPHTSVSTESTLRRPARRDWRDGAEAAGSQTLRARPRAIADRYRDDLAVRRLSGATSRSPSALSGRISSPTGMDPRVSYLLCSEAYAPKIDGRTSASNYVDSLERRLRVDDLHYRAVRPAVAPQEPPFGVPRNHQLPVKSVAPTRRRPTATERLRSNSKTSFLEFDNCGPEQNNRTSSLHQADDEQQKQQQQQPQYKAMSPTRAYNQVYKSATADLQRTRRPANESRVSFSPITSTEQVNQKEAKLAPSPDGRLTSRASGCASADSGIAATSIGADSPVLQQYQKRSADLRPEGKSRRREEARNLEREIEMLDNSDGNDLDEDVILAELDKAVEQHQQTTDLTWSPSESPMIERVQTEMRAAPSRRRPRISIAEPRSKSPLLRVSGSQRPTNPAGELEKKPEHQTVIIQRYEDSWPRRKRSSEREKRNSTEVDQAMSSIEFQCDFEDEDDEDDDGPQQTDSYNASMQRRHQSPVVTYESSQSSSTPNETSGSSLERLEPVGRSSARHVVEKATSSAKLDAKQSIARLKSSSDVSERTKPKIADRIERPIMFSIGQYDSSFNKRELKIL